MENHKNHDENTLPGRVHGNHKPVQTSPSGRITRLPLPPGMEPALKGVFQKYPSVRRVYLIGSRARGDYRSKSDIDLAVMNPGVDEGTMEAMAAEIRSLQLSHKTDLVNYPALRWQPFIDHVQRVGKLFYWREEGG